MICDQKELKRPGGFEITEKAFSLCGFSEGSTIIDIGCGSGATVKYLADKYKFNTFGIDININNSFLNENIVKASSYELPFYDSFADGIIMECCFSLMKNQSKVLEEVFRVLKSKGKLIITDMYARGETGEFSGCIGKIEKKENIISLLNENKFEIEHFEDFTHHLQTMWGQMIFNKGAEAFYCELGVSPDVMKKVKCGYYLLIANKKDFSK